MNIQQEVVQPVQEQIVPTHSRMYEVLHRVQACGALEHPNKVALGYSMFTDFCDGRRLKYEPWGKEFIPWLYKSRFYSKKWYDTYDVLPPFKDHVRYFVDQDTRARIVTSQPYILTVAQDECEFTDFKCDSLELPKEFTTIYCDCVNARLKDQFKPLPIDLPVVKESIDRILAKAKRVSDMFADVYGLHATVSFNGWYNPQYTLLIEYSRSQT